MKKNFQKFQRTPNPFARVMGRIYRSRVAFARARKTGRCVRQKASPRRLIYLRIAADLFKESSSERKRESNSEFARDQTRNPENILKKEALFVYQFDWTVVSGKRRARVDPCVSALPPHDGRKQLGKSCDEKTVKLRGTGRLGDTARSRERKKPVCFESFDHF